MSTTKPRQIAFAIDPSSEEANKTIQWSIDNFLKPTDEIHAIMVMVLDSEFGKIIKACKNIYIFTRAI